MVGIEALKQLCRACSLFVRQATKHSILSCRAYVVRVRMVGLHGVFLEGGGRYGRGVWAIFRKVLVSAFVDECAANSRLGCYWVRWWVAPLVLFEAPWKPAELTQDYTGVDPKHRNSWPAIGIPGNLEAAQAYLGSHGNTWPAIGISGQKEYLVASWWLGGCPSPPGQP